mmetsp:Transcript_7874/g.17217  ORF Transcript_7874/g.17217 Transcript_7874/m.17217 type:complete len:110 (-) Transcript_7874:3520-3849(-)
MSGTSTVNGVCIEEEGVCIEEEEEAAEGEVGSFCVAIVAREDWSLQFSLNSLNCWKVCSASCAACCIRISLSNSSCALRMFACNALVLLKDRHAVASISSSVSLECLVT